MTEKLYTPQPGHLAYRVMQFFVRNPDDDLTLNEVVVKFGVNRTAIPAGLAKAIRAKLIAKATRGSGQVVYVPGPMLAAYVAGNPKALGLHLDPINPLSASALGHNAADLAETVRLARLIADDASRTDIECHCKRVHVDGHDWYDTEAFDSDDGAACLFLSDSMKYLRLRGHFIQHPTQPALIRFA